MTAAKLIALIVGLTLATVDSSPVTTSDVAPATATTSCPPPGAKCGIEIQFAGNYRAVRDGLKSAEECWAFFQLPRKWGEYKSFSYDGDTCYVHPVSLSDFTERPGSGLWAWDAECWACKDSSTSSVPTPTASGSPSTSTCLSPTAMCEVEIKESSDVSRLSPRAVGANYQYPLACWELCIRRPPNCLSFTWSPSTNTCITYKSAEEIPREVEEGSDVWLWDLECWTCGATPFM